MLENNEEDYVRDESRLLDEYERSKDTTNFETHNEIHIIVSKYGEGSSFSVITDFTIDEITDKIRTIFERR